MKVTVKREVKIALLVIFALVILYYGLNYLKGINLFNPVNKFYVHYTSVEGLVPSASVYVKGYEVGQVESISYDFTREEPFLVTLSVEKALKVPKGTVAELYDDGLMGGKAVRLVFATCDELQVSGDTLASHKVPGLMDMLAGDFLPKLYQTIDDVDSTVLALKAIVESPELKGSLKSVEQMTASLSTSAEELQNLMQGKVPSVVANIDTISSDLKSVSSELKAINYVELVAKVDSTMGNIQAITENINDTAGTLGLLLKDGALYTSLDSTVNSANALLKDLKEHPKRYVHFSLFGKKDKEKK